MAYDAGFSGGARVAATVNAAGDLLIVTGVGAGGGPHVKVFRVTDLATGAVEQLGPGFLAYDPGFTGGVNVGASSAAPPAIAEFLVPTAPGHPYGIAAGPDGNLWFTEDLASRIGRITPAGAITEFPLPAAGSVPAGIAAGPDGNLWFTEFERSRVGRITPAGAITEFLIPTAGSGPARITAGPDGNLWFTEFAGNTIGRITPAGAITEFPLPAPASGPAGITAGLDGNLWFTELAGDRIGRITPAGAITEFPLPAPGSYPTGITAGPDGNLWFTEAQRIGRITPAGAVTEFALPTAGSAPTGITVGPDGNLWFTETGGNRIGRITPAGAITELAVPTGASNPIEITVGPDGNLWFTEQLGNRIGRVDLGLALISTGTGPGGGPHVKLFSFDAASATAKELGGGVMAYDPGFTGGVQATVAQVGGELFVVTGVGSGGGPHIRLFEVTDPAAGTVVPVGPGFMAYDPGFTGGARVAATVNVAGDLLIVTGVGSGGGPHVKVFRVTDLATGAVVQLGSGFMAYDPGFTGGVNVGAE
jgi:streptogramin lyase